mmetsp:Transcript_24720/g.79824  ORF Transcript_24720/g.79824 Transcript_24720/m.79824 type:complete len:200 (+) Transcript_24720:1894-2493(+)
MRQGGSRRSRCALRRRSPVQTRTVQMSSMLATAARGSAAVLPPAAAMTVRKSLTPASQAAAVPAEVVAEAAAAPTSEAAPAPAAPNWPPPEPGLARPAGEPRGRERAAGSAVPAELAGAPAAAPAASVVAAEFVAPAAAVVAASVSSAEHVGRPAPVFVLRATAPVPVGPATTAVMAPKRSLGCRHSLSCQPARRAGPV